MVFCFFHDAHHFVHLVLFEVDEGALFFSSSVVFIVVVVVLLVSSLGLSHFLVGLLLIHSVFDFFE